MLRCIVLLMPFNFIVFYIILPLFNLLWMSLETPIRLALIFFIFWRVRVWCWSHKHVLCHNSCNHFHETPCSICPNMIYYSCLSHSSNIRNKLTFEFFYLLNLSGSIVPWRYHKWYPYYMYIICISTDFPF